MDALHTILEQTLGYQFIGAIISVAIYGITVLQTYIYFARYHKIDSWKLQSTVLFLWVLDTVCSALVSHSLYVVLVKDWGVVDSLAHVPATFTLENGFTCLVTVIVQCFFAHRVWLVSGRSTIITPLFITVFALASFGSGLALTARIFLKGNTVDAVENDHFVNVSCIVDQTVAAVCDIIITISLCWYLSKGRDKKYAMKETNSVLQSLMIYFINRGVLTAIIQILAVTTFSGLHAQEVWMLWHLTLSKVYVNSLLAILNARKYLRATLNGDNAGISISGLQFDHGTTHTNSDGTQTTNMVFAVEPKRDDKNDDDAVKAMTSV